MMNLKNIFEAEPTAIAEAVRQVLFVAALLGLIVLDEKALAAIAIAVSGVLSLLVRQNVYAPDTVRELLDDR